MKYNKRKFQTILSSDKINFRGHQKALMRIMDGTSRQVKGKMVNDEKKQKFSDIQGQEDIEDLALRRQLGLRKQEEELRQYEERVFVEHIVNNDNPQGRKAF